MYDKVTYLEHPDETRKRKEAEAAEAAAARKAAEAEAHNRAKKHTAADTDKPTGAALYIHEAGTDQSTPYVLLQGWVCSSKSLSAAVVGADAGGRQNL